MKPTIALVGRPNVGKSTLFNRLTRTKDALVHDLPGLTRDRHYGHGRLGSKPYLVIDTGGFEPVVDSGILHEMAKQTLQAVDEADAVVFLVDARTGLTPQDKIIADRLRQSPRPVYLAVNKGEGGRHDVLAAEFYELALGEPNVISGAHGDGVYHLIEKVLEHFPDAKEESNEVKHPVFAVIGRPNVGKSTLVNAILGEERVIAFDMAGTTRDSIHIDFEREGKPFTIIDTAGVRRRGKVDEAVEKFSVIKAMQAVEAANVAVLVLDAQQDIADQDATIAGFALEAGRALVIAVNKWDGISEERRNDIKRNIARKLYFLDFAKFHYISALKERGIDGLFDSIQAAYDAAFIKMPTPKITRVLQSAIERQQPARAGLVRPKMRYAHQGGMNPPVIVIHGNSLQHIPDSYTRYLTQTFRKAFNLQGTPLRIQYNVGENPYEEETVKAKKQPPRRMALSNRIAKREERKEDKQRVKKLKKRPVSVKKLQGNDKKK
ncbi:ribosome biogenesis GTPase Der [Neisseria elongata]|uniref:ribosome biogenesis GTPase Der n=1 Tax=Neisseria elongata TaxID=495 RepID=UPI0006668933|nr:ribosome biogenesis GTPase Der [Neisseria elongata]